MYWLFLLKLFLKDTKCTHWFQCPNENKYCGSIFMTESGFWMTPPIYFSDHFFNSFRETFWMRPFKDNLHPKYHCTLYKYLKFWRNFYFSEFLNRNTCSRTHRCSLTCSWSFPLALLLWKCLNKALDLVSFMVYNFCQY